MVWMLMARELCRLSPYQFKKRSTIRDHVGSYFKFNYVAKIVSLSKIIIIIISHINLHLLLLHQLHFRSSVVAQTVPWWVRSHRCSHPPTSPRAADPGWCSSPGCTDLVSCRGAPRRSDGRWPCSRAPRSPKRWSGWSHELWKKRAIIKSFSIIFWKIIWNQKWSISIKLNSSDIVIVLTVKQKVYPSKNIWMVIPGVMNLHKFFSLEFLGQSNIFSSQFNFNNMLWRLEILILSKSKTP